MKTVSNDEPMQLQLAKAQATQRPRVAIAKKLPGGCGAEITGVDLSQPISESSREDILAAFAAHHLLVFRNQQLDKRQFGEVAAIFGEVEGNVFRNPDGATLEAIHQISNLDAAGRPAENPYLKSNYFWHSDKAYLPVPALLTMLHAVELPPSGGDTQFADMIRAHASLTDDVKRRISGLRAVHSLEYTAYRLIAAFVLLMPIVLGLMTSNRAFVGIFMSSIIMLLFSLPQAIILWTEPDMPGETG